MSTPAAVLPLAAKVMHVFGDVAIDKRRLPMSHLQKRGVPAYVGEWIIERIVPGSGELEGAEAATLQEWASRYIPGPGDSNLIKSQLLRGDIVKVLTPVTVEVELSRRRQERVAKMSLLGLSDVHISDSLVEQYPDLLKQGMWGVVELANTQEGVTLHGFKPMQAAMDLELFKEARRAFTLEEWRTLILASMGYNAAAFTSKEQDLLLCRLLPLAQKNMHTMELAPKGTGKSYIYENISPRVRLVSGGNLSPAVLFVNNASGQWGLLARYSVVVLDEVQTLRFEKPEEIVGGLKGFLANGRITRGGLHETASDCSFALLANITLNAQQKPLNDLLVEELPLFLQETAFLDRLRALIPGWRIRKLSNDCFAQGIGLKSDYFGDAILALRDDLSHDQAVARRLTLTGKRIYKRNQDAVLALASGLMKILFPHGDLSDAEFESYCVRPACELRQGIWSQLQQLDGEYRQYDAEITYSIG